jgi:hypothetical protein
MSRARLGSDMLARLPGFVALVVFALPAAAHEIRPAFLQLREVQSEIYEVLWKTPAQGDLRLALNVILPSGCRSLGQPRATLVNAAAIEHQVIACAGGITGKQIHFENLATTLTDVIVRFEPMQGSSTLLRVNGAAPFVEIPGEQSVGEVFWGYVRFGLEHILIGFDHLLFVLCLLMLVGDFRRLLAAITAFTVAHSITLATTTLGWVRLASAPVEASIALSIAFLAAEIIKARDGRPSLAQRLPWMAAFGFGLLHGFGFASALREVGLPQQAVPLALLSFNLGVEVGQLLFVAAALLAMFLWRKYMPRSPVARAWRVAPYIAGVVASFWFIQRTLQILS